MLILRMVQGSLLAGHGAQKLFGWFGGHGLEGTSGWLESLGLRPGRPWAVLAGLSEFGGGVLTLLGLLNPLGPLGVLGSMAMATAKVHSLRPIWVTEGGAELPVTNAAISAALMINGPGRYSVDRALSIRLPGWLAPLGLLAVILTVGYMAAGSDSAPEEDQAHEELAGEEEAAEGNREEIKSTIRESVRRSRGEA
ncbi:MAG TPA: DoxX family protein [Rubrobacteraceae bacterium]|nr:DoxX family protein [Rubrobacteraceae bacterium]